MAKKTAQQGSPTTPRPKSKSPKSSAPRKAASKKKATVPQAASVTAGHVAASAANHAADANLDKIDHIVVLMMENRSFDHMLGYLKLNHGHSSDGLTTTMSNQFKGKNYRIHHLKQTVLKSGQDPCHEGACVTEQLLNNNGGFVANYAHTHPGDPDFDLVMGYFQKEDVPVFHALSQSFCVCDRWFSSVDGATWPNRLYSIAGKASSSKDNTSIPMYNLPSFVRHLDQKRVTWNWYSHEAPSTLRLVDGQYRLSLRPRFHFVEHSTKKCFLRDAANGDLPSVSWIDPDFSDLGFTGNDDHPPSDIRKGQELILKVINAVQSGPQWKKTLLVIVYDEHGGFFDHVVPPAAVDSSPIFRRYGVRVPAIIVSPWVVPGSVSSEIFDHTSIVKTILTRFCKDSAGAIPVMSDRVTAANHLGAVLSRSTAAPAPAMTGAVAAMSKWKAEEFHESLSMASEAKAAAGVRNDLQEGLAKARAKLIKLGLPEGAL
jgi:phospholipase C